LKVERFCCQIVNHVERVWRRAVKKSLIIIASALLFAVGAATHDRLRYDSGVFSEAESPTGGPRAVRVEYPPCVKGVREDRCIQLYERGVRRNYERWLAAHGRGGERVAARAPSPARAYRPCRSRSDDRCEQRSARRHARNVREVRAVRRARAHHSQRAVARPVTHRRVMVERPVRQPRAAVVREVRRTTTTTTTTRTVQQRQQPAPTTRPSPPHRHAPPAGTPGI
jgi:hypothetical protein